MASVILLGALLAGAAPRAVAAQAGDDCGGYLNRRVTGFLYGAAGAVLARGREHEICGLGVTLRRMVLEGHFDERVADEVWDRAVLRLGFCERDRVSAPASAWFDLLPGPGREIRVAERYCRESWTSEEEGVDQVRLRDLTPWFRGEVFCEQVSNVPLPGIGPPTPADDLVELGEELCAGVRSAEIDVDDAANRWGRELERVQAKFGGLSGLAAHFVRGMAWATSGILQALVAATAFLATLVGIAVGVKKLLE